MKKINNIFQEEAYHYVTEAGLNVFIIEKKGFKRSVAAYGTPFGGIHLNQIVDGEKVTHKKGLAHFLEHKMFEDEKGDLLSQFTDLGANANAFTSYDQTVYYFNTNDSIEEPLKLLIHLINRIHLDEASIEKEKGIIVEELRMYEKNPNMNLLMKTYENVYHHFPLRYDIGGTEESVNATTLEDVLAAYNYNYNPKKMALVVVTGEAKEDVKRIIDKSKIRSSNVSEVTNVFQTEPYSVLKEHDQYYFAVNTPKSSLSFKFKYDGKNIMRDEFTIRSILSLNFSQLNDDYQNWLDEDIINDYFSYDVDLRDGFGVIYFFNEGNKNEEFKELIMNKMNNLEIEEALLNQSIRRHYGNSILSLSQYDRYAINVMSCFFKNESYYDYLSFIKDFSIKDIHNVLPYLSDYSISHTEMLPKRKK